MAFTTLISTSELADHLTDPAFAIIDCRFKLDDVSWGSSEYANGHIPGAVYASLDNDLSGPKNGTNGRHPLPSAETLARRLSQFGIASSIQVVAYNQDNGMYASRLWWLLRWLGHDAVAVLDGGFAKWTAEGRTVRREIEVRAPREFVPSIRPDMAIDAQTVAARSARPEWRLVDARAGERYRGDVEPIDRQAGHIPGAANHFFGSNLTENKTFKRPEDLRVGFQAALGGVSPNHIVCYCGSGVTACHNLLALEHAGITGAVLYPGILVRVVLGSVEANRERLIGTANRPNTGSTTMRKLIAVAMVIGGSAVVASVVAVAQPVQSARCLHGAGEQPAQRTRRELALKLAQQINQAEYAGPTLLPSQPKRDFKPFAQLKNLPATPSGFKLQFYTDVETYTFSLKDTLDACEFAIFSDQDKGIYEGAPQSGTRVLPAQTF